MVPSKEAASVDHRRAIADRDVEAVLDATERLLERGRREGAFRSDLSADWLVASCMALMHAAVIEVRAGRMSPAAAQRALLASIRDLWVGASS